MARANKSEKTQKPAEVQNAQQASQETAAAENAEQQVQETTANDLPQESAAPAENLQSPAEKTEESGTGGGQNLATDLESSRRAAPDGNDLESSSEEEKSRLSIDEHAMRLNIPGWQHAALCRLLGWASGKLVSEAEYKDGLAALHARRQGGGR